MKRLVTGLGVLVTLAVSWTLTVWAFARAAQDADRLVVISDSLAGGVSAIFALFLTVAIAYAIGEAAE